MKSAVEPSAIMRFPFRPRYDGANIRTWIGFKQFMAVIEEAVLQWHRERGLEPGRLYLEHGLGLEVIDSSVQLPALVEIDDELGAEVAEREPGQFAVRLHAYRDTGPVLVAHARVAVALIRDQDVPLAVADPPESVASLVVPTVAAAAPADGRRDHHAGPGWDLELLAPPGSGAFLWSWQARYFHCHFSDRVQHSAYTRALEEVVDRFLADRGLSVATLLRQRAWIPVVSRARVRLLADAHMEEIIHTVFVVEDILRGVAYQARMDCFVRRGERMVHCATGSILHGYALSSGQDAGQLVELDPATQAALLRGPGR